MEWDNTRFIYATVHYIYKEKKKASRLYNRGTSKGKTKQLEKINLCDETWPAASRALSLFDFLLNREINDSWVKIIIKCIWSVRPIDFEKYLTLKIF